MLSIGIFWGPTRRCRTRSHLAHYQQLEWRVSITHPAHYKLDYLKHRQEKFKTYQRKLTNDAMRI